MQCANALDVIYKVAKMKMSEVEAAAYVGEVVTFSINAPPIMTLNACLY
jgi:hypothetical protein